MDRSAKSNPAPHSLGLRHYLWIVALAWSVLIGILLATNIGEMQRGILNLAHAEATTSLNKDITYRRWAAFHGGVYVPATEATPPNPYLAGIPERDITTPSGRPLTLMNPAYMTRQVQEMGKELYGTRGHITSLNPLRPGNAPDAWEAATLRSFTQGKTEHSEMVDLDGNPRYRLMRVMIAEKGCLKCHAAQGYKEGDVRGGISVSIPLEPYLMAGRAHSRNMVAGYGTIWALGLGGLGLASQRLRRRMKERDQAEEALRESENLYRSLFVNMLNGFAYCQMHFDDRDRPVDFTYLSVNGAFETLTGLANVEGKKVSEVIPGIRESDPGIFEIYGRVSQTGKPERFEIWVSSLGMWFWISVYCPERGYFVAVFDVITERKQAEEALQCHAAELKATNDELTRFNRAATDRELRMIEIKREINELCAQTGRPPRYALEFAETPPAENPAAGPETRED